MVFLNGTSLSRFIHLEVLYYPWILVSVVLKTIVKANLRTSR